MASFLQTVTIDTVTCYKCGVEFGMPARMLKTRRESGGEFWCPNGHSQAFRETENMRLEKAAKRAQELLEQERRRREQADTRANEECERADREAKRVRLLKKRAAAGSCPCCQRNFGNLARHMQTKHPDYAKS